MAAASTDYDIPMNGCFVFQLAVLLMLAAFSGCAAGNDPQQIVDRAVAAHGGDSVRHASIAFDFRDRHYKIINDGGRFQYERIWRDSTGLVRDVLNNDGFFREIDGRRVSLPEERSRAFSSSVNSVAYFALLPFPLNDEAVKKRYLGTADVEGQPYHKVEITFRQEGGGRDYQDRFVYWFHRDRHTMDYLAYDYLTDGGGARFRKAVNPRTIGGIRFADYLNYTADGLDAPGVAIEDYDEVLEAGEVELISEIIMENITVQSLR